MNIVIIKGRLSRDPEVKTTASGMTVSRFSVAVDRVAKKGEERKADFISCVAFSNTAQTVAKYLTKGREVALQGRIQTGSYVADDGSKRYTTDVIVDRFEFCGKADSKPADEVPFF